MRLIRLRVTNFRRFGGQHSLDLDERIIALVGPNEAGKSSILAALDLLGRRTPPAPTDRTRIASEPASIAGHYLLDADDRPSLSEISGSEQVSRVWVTYREGREHGTWELIDRPSRDLAPRHSLAPASALTWSAATTSSPV